MCGICGIYSLQGKPIDEVQLVQMRDSMIHRGPDDKGLFIDSTLGFGFRRLSIIDLETGNQPIFNEDKSIIVMCNGEIYNYKELREYLLKERHIFTTRSDTEVLVHLYEEFGDEFIEKLNGMFTIALYDIKNRKLLLARDRAGEKPLYYVNCNNMFYFASEMKAFLLLPEIPKELRADLLPEFLAFGNVYGENTLLRGIYELLPAHVLTMQNGRIRIREYWDVSYSNIDNRDEEYFKNELDKMFNESVRMRLMSDVSLGAFLSGGLDSSMIVALMSRHMDKPVKTFSVGFNEKGFDELEYARNLTRNLNMDHHELMVDRHTFFNALPGLINYQDEPINHHAAIPLYLLAKYAKKEGVTVLLSGEGADELFAGYDSYRALLRDLKLRKLFPRNTWGICSKLFERFNMPKYSSICERYSGSVNDLLYGSSSFLPKSTLSRIFNGEVKDLGYFFDVLSKNDSSALGQILYTHLKTRLVTLLMKQDKMTMAASVETRVPFLDYRIIDLASAMPDNLKMRGNHGKYVLKKIAAKYLPSENILRKKIGFNVPIGMWFKSDSKYTSILHERRTLERGLFNYNAVRQILNEYLSGHYDYSSTIWNLLNLEIWIRVFIEGDKVARQDQNKMSLETLIR